MSNRLQLTQLAASIALVAGSAAFISSAHAAAPAAGTNISNVASASYTDSTGNTKTVSSNIVTTTVLPVASFTLIADRTANANANNQVSLSHTLTNTGNGSDTFTVNVADVTSGDQYDFSNLKVYLDANKDGTPDSQTPVTSVTLAAGESVNLIVQATTPTTGAGGGALSAGDLGKLTITAQSTLDSTLTATNTDTVKITSGAVISVIKSASVTAIDATQASATAREVEYKLVYQNTGNTTATAVTVTDLLPAGLTYVAGSAKLAGVTQTDSVDADGYKFVETTSGSGKGTVTLTIPTLAPNTTGTLTFKVRVDKDTPAGVIRNTAYVDPDGPLGSEGNTPSNPNDINILSIKKGTINDNQGDAYADGEAITSDTTKDDQIVIATIKQGEVAEFSATGQGGEPIVIHNTGNVSEEFTVSVDKGTDGAGGLPAGSIVTLYQADGVTPFISTGSIPSGGTYNLVAKVTLPASYSTSSAIKAILTTSPKSDATKTDTLDLVISQVTPATVDLHNGDASDTNGSVLGASGKDTGLDIDVRSTKPNQAVNFPLQVDNSGVTGDNFNLGIDPAHALPAGWDVKFYVADSSGNPTGAPLTNTGNINGGSNIKLVAVVTPPANAPAGDQQVYFKVSSPATGLSDVMVNKVTVQADRKLSLQNDRIGQVAPGGTVVYKHTLTNTGNIVEGATATSLPFTLTNDKSGNGWVTSLFIDVNNDGNIDAGDTLVTGDLATATGAIARNASVNFLIKVQAPSNATAGTPSSVVFTINPTTVGGITHSSISNTDLTTVTEGQVRLVKEQVLVNCATGMGGTYAQTTVSAKPGECVKYRIVATNEGNATVTNVVISDNTPSYTTLKAISGVSPLATSATLQNTGNYVDGYTGTVSAEQSPLAPNASATLEFVIKVNPLTP